MDDDDGDATMSFDDNQEILSQIDSSKGSLIKNVNKN